VGTIMRIFKQDVSYIGVFAVFAVFFVGVGMIGGNRRLAALSLPMVIGGILICQLLSGIALESWWRAKYEKGTCQYSALIACHTHLGTLAQSVAAWFLWTSAK
jgi:hypothetical protein